MSVDAALFHRNLSMREARRLARRLGVVEELKSNSEARFRDPASGRHVVTKRVGRHDCSRKLLSFLRRLAVEGAEA